MDAYIASRRGFLASAAAGLVTSCLARIGLGTTNAAQPPSAASRNRPATKESTLALEEEVRYHMLRPDQIVSRRKACPAVYIPLGILEWHGRHNAVGADALQAEGLAIMAARKGGGMAFPTLYYGEPRIQGLMEANNPAREQIAAAMDLPAENFSPAAAPYGEFEMTRQYNQLLQYILYEAGQLGFRVGALVCGHYPLLSHAKAAAENFNMRERTRRTEDGLLAWACADFALLRGAYPFRAGDHAGGWETSHMMALHPQTVDLSVLPADKTAKLLGAGGAIPPQDSSAAFGWETMNKATDAMIAEVRHRLDYRSVYQRAGESMLEGQWREKPKPPTNSFGF